MHHLKLVAVFGATIFLAACGGGGGSDTPTQPVEPPKKTYYTPNTPRTGDTYHYTVNRAVNGFSLYTAGISSYTNQYGLVAADGSIYLNRYDNTYLSSNSLLNRQGNLLRQNRCTFSPALNGLPIPSYVGQSYNQTTSAVCTSEGYYPIGMPSSVVISSTVQSHEPVTIAAGQFNTLKITSELKITLNTGVVSTESDTCWVDVASGASVKCRGTVHYDFTQVKPQYHEALAAYLGGGTDISSIELTAVQHASDFPFSLTASLNGVAISGVYQTPFEQQLLRIVGDDTLTLSATQPLNWTISSAVTNTAFALKTGDQVVVIDGVSVSVSIMGGKISAKALNTPVSGVFIFVLKGSSLIDPAQSTSVIVDNSILQSPYFQVVPNCSSSLKFC